MQNVINEAKIRALTNQRNHALNECVTLAAQISMYEAKVKELQSEIEKLKSVKKKKRVVEAV